ncbi:hypothetical protein UFOVP758_18 [uncultured Caudovirales phage]|uniref:Uncharacterized protein n=1 Tax=uncultured Caudovirales phage TaxID=2100421 RepID=A0A6J7X466_9CAUD|nr:hypothetical protein UFOVP758_18 [uncultured Caudovirales phage]
MTCEILCDYHLKQSGATFSADFGIEFIQTTLAASPVFIQFDSVITCEASIIKKKNNKVQIDWACLGVNWKPNHEYRLVFGSDTFRDVANSKKQGNPEFEVTFTSNPLPALRITDPSFQSDPLPNSTDVINNTKIEFVFDRVMRTDCPGKLYLYENAATDILIKTYTMGVDIESKIYSDDLTKFTIDTLGLLKANTNYYVISDGIVFRDWDNLAYPAFAPGDYTFTTDQSTDNFPDLISFVLSSGTLAATFIRYRDPGSTVIDATATLTGPENWRLRRSPSDLITTSDQSAGLTYANGGLSSQLLSQSEFVDIFLTYANALGQANINSVTDMSSIPGYLRRTISNFVQSIFSTNINNNRNRSTPSSISSEFTNSFTGDWAVLTTFRAAETYSTNTTVSITNGPLFPIKNTTGDGAGTYTVTIQPDDLTAVTNLNTTGWSLLQSPAPATNSSFGYYTSLSKDMSTMAVSQFIDTGPGFTASKVYIFIRSGPNKLWTQQTLLNVTQPSSYIQFGWKTALSSDGNTLAITASGNYVGNYTLTDSSFYVYTRSGSTWTQQARITSIYDCKTIDISSDGNTISVSGTDATNGSGLFIYTRTGSSWTKQTTTPLGSVNDISSGNSLSNDGNTLFDGKIVYTRSGTTWSVSNDLSSSLSNYTWFSSTAYSDYSYAGWPVARMSKDGNTIISAYDTNLRSFVRSGSTWTYESSQNVLFKAYESNFSISENGSQVIVSWFLETNSGGTRAGSVRCYSRNSGVWSMTGPYRYSSNPSGSNWFGYGLTLSADGGFAIIQQYNNGGAIGQAGSLEFFYFNGTPSFNSSTKTLTITGKRLQVNEQIDHMFLVPGTGYTSNFNLVYTGTVPDGRSTTRTQAVTRV